MASLVITLLFTLLIVFGLVLLFLWVKTPYYRVDCARMIAVLEMALTGQATENDWYIAFSLVIRHDEELEYWRQRCVEIEEAYFSQQSNPPYLFSVSGLGELEDVLKALRLYCKQSSLKNA